MTLLLVSDGGLERSACLLMAEALEHQGQRCITAGPKLHGHQPLATPAQQLNIDLQHLPAHPLLDQVSAIGLFLEKPEQVQHFIETYQGLSNARGRRAAKLFSGPIVPLVGDALIRDLTLRMGCDLLLVSGPDLLLLPPICWHACTARRWPRARGYDAPVGSREK